MGGILKNYHKPLIPQAKSYQTTCKCHTAHHSNNYYLKTPNIFMKSPPCTGTVAGNFTLEDHSNTRPVHKAYKTKKWMTQRKRAHALCTTPITASVAWYLSTEQARIRVRNSSLNERRKQSCSQLSIQTMASWLYGRWIQKASALIRGNLSLYYNIFIFYWIPGGSLVRTVGVWIVTGREQSRKEISCTGPHCR